MPRKKQDSRIKLHRVQMDMQKEDLDILKKISESRKGNQSDTIRKALRILDAIYTEESYLTTPKGDRIPRSIIFS